MHKSITLLKHCVKNVNNLRTPGCENSVHSSTYLISRTSLCNHNSAQTQLLNNYIQQSSTTFYTTLSSKFNLLSKTFTHNPQPLLMSPTKEN